MLKKNIKGTKHKKKHVIGIALYFIIYLFIISCDFNNPFLTQSSNTSSPDLLPQYFVYKDRYYIQNVYPNDAVMGDDGNFIYASVIYGVVKLAVDQITGELSFIGFCDLNSPLMATNFSLLRICGNYLYVTYNSFARIALVTLDNFQYSSNQAFSTTNGWTGKNFFASSDGQNMYSLYSNNISQYKIESTGILTLETTYNTGVTVDSMNISPDGNNIYFNDKTNNTIKWYTRDLSGDLSCLKSLDDTDPANSIISNGRNIIISGDNTLLSLIEGNSISIFNISIGGDITLKQKIYNSDSFYRIAYSQNQNIIYSTSMISGLWIDSFNMYRENNSDGLFHLIKENVIDVYENVTSIFDSPDGNNIYYTESAVHRLRYMEWPN
ncbi:MAG: hypothetical protein JXB50_13635 [Spirochaetes bacterium]|nr:hypothetical protein [Spirochaetota bacterium]